MLYIFNKLPDHRSSNCLPLSRADILIYTEKGVTTRIQYGVVALKWGELRSAFHEMSLHSKHRTERKTRNRADQTFKSSSHV